MIFSPIHLARFALIAATLLSSCRTTAASEPRPALLAARSDSNLEKITEAVSKAVGVKVTLAPDSFVTKPSVTIEPPSVNKRNGHIIDGRSLEMPTHVDLIMMGRKCFIINRDTGVKHPLKGVSCTPVEKN